MFNFSIKNKIIFGGLFLLISGIFTNSADAQRRDYMTDPEIEIVREAQEIDLRVGALVRMIDRRFAVLNNEVLKKEKDDETWGEHPKGTRGELLSDISKLLQKSIDDIDQVVERNSVDAKMFPKAMKHLNASCVRFVPKLKMEYDKAADEKEKGSIMGSLEFCGQITEATAKLPGIVPKETTKEEKKKKDKKDSE